MGDFFDVEPKPKKMKQTTIGAFFGVAVALASGVAAAVVDVREEEKGEEGRGEEDERKGSEGALEVFVYAGEEVRGGEREREGRGEGGEAELGGIRCVAKRKRGSRRGNRVALEVIKPAIQTLPKRVKDRVIGAIYMGVKGYVKIGKNRSPNARICQQCATQGKPKAADFKDADGNDNTCCGDCAKRMGTWELKRQCELCPDGAKLTANFKNLEGKPKALCAGCAKREGVHQVQNACELCPDDEKRSATFKNRSGQLNKLCSRCARSEGTWHVARVCELCPEEAKLYANFKNADGIANRLCAACAISEGTHATLIAGASKVACDFFDRLARHRNEHYPHVHHYKDESGNPRFRGREVTDLVKGRRIRPDSYIEERREVWLFHGNYWHGYPPEHQKHDDGTGVDDIPNSELYEATRVVMGLYADAGYSVKFVWEHEFAEVRRAKYPRPIESVIRTF